MNRSTLPLPPTTSLAVALALAIAVGSVTAQEAPEELTVEAPRVEHQTVREIGITGIIEDVSLTRVVQYSDLDLQLHADVVELEKRINDAAKEACKELAEMYPLGAPNATVCTRRAVDDAMAQVQELVAAAD